MTPVLMQFLTSTGTPIGFANVEVRLTRSDYEGQVSGVIMPRLVNLVTGMDGKVLVDLMPCKTRYHVTAYDSITDAALHYHFYVPLLNSPGGVVRLQDLIVADDAVMLDKPYDEEALLAILAAKAITMSARDGAVAAMEAAQALADFADDSINVTVDARDVSVAAKDIAVGAKDTATTKAADAAQSAADAAAYLAQVQAGQVQADWTESKPASKAFIQHKPVLAPVAISGNKADIGLGNVDNTADAAKPVSTAAAAAIALKQDAAARDASGGFPGLSGFKLTLKNAAGMVVSYLTSVATVARTWNLPDKDGTIALLSDITGNNSGSNTGDETKAGILSKLGATAVTGSNTGDQTAASLGLGSVNNTADVNKPVSTAQQAALDLKANITYVDAKVAAADQAQTQALLNQIDLIQSGSGDNVGFTGIGGREAKLSSLSQSVAAALFCWNSGQANSVDRPLLEKLGEVVSVKDIGATGDWVQTGTTSAGVGTDDTFRINLAAALARVLKCGLYIPYGRYRVTGTLDFSGLHVYGAGNEQAVLCASSAQFDIVKTTGKTFLRDFGIEGGWDGSTKGLLGDAVSVKAMGEYGDAGRGWPYNVHLENLRIQRVKRDFVLFERGGYSTVNRCKFNAFGGDTGVHMKGFAAPDYCTTIHISNTTMSDGSGYAVTFENAHNCSLRNTTSEYTKGFLFAGSANRAISLVEAYQEFTIGGQYITNTGSGVGLVIASSFGGGGIVPDMPTWEGKTTFGCSNLTICWAADARKYLTASGSESSTTVTGGVDFTAASISVPPGSWDLRAELQTVNGVSATILEAAAQFTMDVAASGRNRTTNANFNFGANDIVMNPGAMANIRVRVGSVVHNTTAANVTWYLRGFVNISAGTLGYKGAIQAIKL